MKDLIERKQSDLDRLTVAVANGYAISMDPKAAAQWRADHGVAPGTSPEAVLLQSATLGRLAGYFPNAVKAKVN